MGLESSISQNLRDFLRVFFLYFSSSESYFLKYKKAPFPEIQKKKFRISVSWNIRIFFVFSISRNIRIAFFWENVKYFSILEYKKFSRGRFFYFSSLGYKIHQVTLWYNTTRKHVSTPLTRGRNPPNKQAHKHAKHLKYESTPSTWARKVRDHASTPVTRFSRHVLGHHEIF